MAVILMELSHHTNGQKYPALQSYNIANANSSGTDVTGLVQGTYQFQLTVTDNNGATATDVVLVTVNAAINISPNATAGTDQIIALPLNTITLSGSGNDVDGTVVKLRLERNLRALLDIIL